MSSDSAAPTNSPSLASRGGARLRAFLRGQRPYLLDYGILGSVLAVVYFAMVKFQTQFFPDSAHYLAMSLWFSGMPRDEALDVVMQESIAHGYEPNTDDALLFDWGLVKPRVVLSALSVPFIWLFGSGGLAVLGALITFVLIVMLHVFLRRRYGRVAALVSLLLTMSGFAIMLFSFGMLTESLSAVWGVIAIAIAYQYQRDRARRWLVLLVVVTLLSAFTRQATFIVAGAFVVAWLLSLFWKSERSKWTLPALVVAGTSLGAQVLQTALFPFSQGDQYLRMTQTDNYLDALAATPRFVLDLAIQEFTYYATADQVMIAFFGLSLISIVVFWRRSESHLLLGALAGIALYNITNGNATHFRYAIPGLVFFLASISLLLAQLQTTERLNRPGSAFDRETPTVA